MSETHNLRHSRFGDDARICSMRCSRPLAVRPGREACHCQPATVCGSDARAVLCE